MVIYGNKAPGKVLEFCSDQNGRTLDASEYGYPPSPSLVN